MGGYAPHRGSSAAAQYKKESGGKWKNALPRRGNRQSWGDNRHTDNCIHFIVKCGQHTNREKKRDHGKEKRTGGLNNPGDRD